MFLPISLTVFHRNSNLMEISFSLIVNLTQRSLLNFVHDTTAVSSWHVQTFVANSGPTMKLWQGEFPIEFELRTKIVSETSRHIMWWVRVIEHNYTFRDLDYWKSKLSSVLVNKDFLTWLLIGWQVCYEPIKFRFVNTFNLHVSLPTFMISHWGRVTHICVRKLGYHWFRQCLVAWSAPSHHLNQFWYIVNWTPRNKLQWNLKRNSYVFIQENRFENVARKATVILSRLQYVKPGFCKNRYTHYDTLKSFSRSQYWQT